MQHQLDLPPAARRTDPETSQRAAERATRTGVRSSQMFRLASLVRRYPGRTGNELAEIIAASDEPRPSRLTERQISRRLNDAHESGLIRPSDRRKCEVTGYLARPWFPV